jgi:hypothetical protein
MTHVVALSDDTPTITLGREFFRLFADQERNGFAKRQLLRAQGVTKHSDPAAA